MVRHSTPHPPGGRLSGVRRSRERLGRCGGRREKHLPWRGQAVAGASAPVNVHAVLLSDNGDNGLCPREDAGNHGLVQRAEEVQKRSFCRRSFPHFFRCWKKWGRRRQRKRSRGGRCPGGEQVLRLRARDGAFRAPARVTFFFCKKKVTKENHSNLRFKDPLARGRQVQIWRCWLRGIGAVGDVVGSGDCLYLLRRCR